MSRIGKKPIVLPKGVEVKVEAGAVMVKGPKGSLSTPVLAGMQVGVKDGKVEVTRQGDEKQDRAFHGLNRALLQNAVLGVTEGYTKKIDLVGVGYKAEVKGNDVVFSCGYSHPVVFPMPAGIKIDVAADAKAKEVTHITVTGADKQKVGQVAKQIREIKPPDPYKLKGFRFVGEILKKKAGKATGK
ncbi:MAG: 50S ribosomal protein L6 [Acidobacteria bacterium]|nr:50S ribosomal protein L6 [Acidobacteriota bacterium]MCG3192483.1 50S ribosomal protein L6 [Thermoanaerobaculia bacterium]MCK6683316.1 50S ribosomal protein L6 [Thermoanaerobaculia bacterium]